MTDLGAGDVESVEDVKSADDRLKGKKVVVVYYEGLQRFLVFGALGVENCLLKGHGNSPVARPNVMPVAGSFKLEFGRFAQQFFS